MTLDYIKPKYCIGNTVSYVLDNSVEEGLIKQLSINIWSKDWYKIYYLIQNEKFLNKVEECKILNIL